MQSPPTLAESAQQDRAFRFAAIATGCVFARHVMASTGCPLDAALDALPDLAVMGVRDDVARALCALMR